MPLMTLHRTFMLRTTKGHAIAFKKGKATFVPPIVVPDAVAIGAQMADGTDADVLDDEPAAEIPMAPAEREQAIREAIEQMVKRNERNDFTGAGVPDIRRLQGITKFEVRKAERDKLWMERNEAQLAASMMSSSAEDA